MAARFRRMLSFAVLFLHGPLLHATTEFVVSHGERRLSGAEVCFSKIVTSGGRVAPAQLFFDGSDLRCLPADTVLEIPVGKFLFFARHPDGYVTRHRSILSQTTPDSEECYSKVGMAAEAAATLDLRGLKPSVEGAYFGVWVEDGEQTQSTFLRANPGDAELLVPANTRLIPMEIAGGVPVRIGATVRLAAAQRHVLRDLKPRAGTSDVIAWLEGSDEAVLAASGTAKLDHPAVRVVTEKGEIVVPEIVPRHFGGFNGSLLVLRNVPHGRGRLQFDGRWWERFEQTVNVSGRDVVVAGPVRFAPAAVVSVQQPVWVEAASFREGCEDAPEQLASVILKRCPEGGECVTAAEKTYDPRAATAVEFTGVPPGTYRADLKLPNGMSGTATVTAVAGKEVSTRVEIPAVTLYGTVLRGRTPVRADIVFPSMERAASGSDGRFRAHLRLSPGLLPIEVTLCDGSGKFMHIPAREPGEYEAFDIVVPDSSIVVRVRDASSAKPVGGARAAVAIRRAEGADEGILFTRSAMTAASGEATIPFLPPGHRATVCATREGYRRACAAPVIVPASGTARVDIDLPLATDETGHLTGLADPARTTLFFTGGAGELLHRVAVAADGSFSYPASLPASHVVIVAPRDPLTVIPNGYRGGAPGGLRLELPRLESRTFAVTVDGLGRRTARVGLVVAGVTIPLAALGDHQIWRNHQASIIDGASIELPDIALAGPVEVRIGPALDDPAYPPDAVTRPEFHGVFPTRVIPPGARTVHFELPR